MHPIGYELVLAFSLIGIATADPYTTISRGVVEPMVLSCSKGPSALECFKKFGTTCDYFCNVINPAPVSIAGGDCNDITDHCACVDISLLVGGTDASGLLINSTDITSKSHSSGVLRPTGHSGHHNHTAGFAKSTGHFVNGTMNIKNSTRTALGKHNATATVKFSITTTHGGKNTTTPPGGLFHETHATALADSTSTASY